MAINKKISVIMTCYNGEEWIAGALESAINQSYKNMEIIVVNDGSLDSSKKIISKYFSDKRVIYVEQENKGVAAARNKGLKLAEGDYICVLDQDDLWLPDKLSKQIYFMENNGWAGAVYTGVRRIDSLGRPLGQRKYPPPLEGDLFRHFLKIRMGVPIVSVMIRKKLFDIVGGFDEHLFGKDDWDLLLRLARRTEFGFIPEILVEQRFRPGTAGQSEPMYQDNFYLVEKYKKLWKDSLDLIEEFEWKSHYAYASFLFASGRKDEAKLHFANVLKKKPLYPKALIKLILCNIYGN